MLMSAILPGSGEIYSGNLSRGVFFLTADLVILFKVNQYGNDVNNLRDSYKQFALAKADVPKDRKSDYYNLINNWYGAEQYNAALEQYYRNLGIYDYNDPNFYSNEIASNRVTGDYVWQWDNKKDWNSYRLIRKDKQKQLMNQKLAIGAAIVNRVISILDTTYLIKKGNRQVNTSFSVTPDLVNQGAMLNCSVEF
jgi:hypothetical protein